MAEDAVRDLPNLPLEDALQLVHLYAERGSPKFEKAAMRWLERYGRGIDRRAGGEVRDVVLIRLGCSRCASGGFLAG